MYVWVSNIDLAHVKTRNKEDTRARAHTHTYTCILSTDAAFSLDAACGERTDETVSSRNILRTDDAPMLGTDRSSAPTHRERA